MNDNNLLSEIRQRCIHIENKLNTIIGVKVGHDMTSKGYIGHSDQAFGGSTYAQHGDDLITLNIFHCLNIARPSYLDIGAHHPVNISNTALLYAKGSRGINIEANPMLMQAFEELRPEDKNINVGVSDAPGTLKFYMIDSRSGRNTFDLATAEAFVASHPECKIRNIVDIDVVTINQIIEQHANGKCPDFLSIDAEGLDARILKSMNFTKYRPKVICVETISGDGTGSPDMILETIAKADYSFYFRTIGNVFFVENSLISLLRP